MSTVTTFTTELNNFADGWRNDNDKNQLQKKFASHQLMYKKLRKYIIFYVYNKFNLLNVQSAGQPTIKLKTNVYCIILET